LQKKKKNFYNKEKAVKMVNKKQAYDRVRLFVCLALMLVVSNVLHGFDRTCEKQQEVTDAPDEVKGRSFAPQKAGDYCDYDPFQGINLLKSGNGWEMWDRRSAPAHQDAPCQWATFRPARSKHGTRDAVAARMCTYPKDSDRYVSSMIQTCGRWYDCDTLVTLWNAVESDKGSKSIYIEIGANIGSCVMQMLFSTNASIVAFEPDPRNFALLTTTLMVTDCAHRNRVSLFPLALGSSRGNGTINAAADNRGNAVVNQIVKDKPTQRILAPIPIIIETLDSIFAGVNLEDLSVPLMKMDVQGFECYVVDGMRNVLERTSIIKTEKTEQFLQGQGCSAEKLVKKLEDSKFILDKVTDKDDVIGRK
jgi:FkbM family methyltransferase